ncbi:winged helix-turn-helix transcriptional regulator [Clostridium ganghwense]|uniref:winged helix-turn-helix transcriptional regulator n=1 Tax=Clostridium ganghwense TaxID=312089 RepID=UPI002342E59D|nr:helix-turn-helix domain-containing protein [Clostridium ganghwense]
MPEDRINKISCSNYRCEIEVALEIISGKWNALILWTLGTEGTKRFGELKRSLSGVTQKMLTQQLRTLEKYGIVERTIYPEVPPVVEYSLTEMGNKLIPIFKELDKWGKEYIEHRKTL